MTHARAGTRRALCATAALLLAAGTVAAQPPRGVAGGTSKGSEGGTGPVISDQPYFEFQVEKPVVQAPGTAPPRYPETLRSARVEGTALVQFVVDTAGRVEPGSVKVLKSDHALFSAAVRTALDSMRFVPAETSGRKVRQLVQQLFRFSP